MFHGLESLKFQYKVIPGYLKAVEKEQIIEWMRAQSYLIEFCHNYPEDCYSNPPIGRKRYNDNNISTSLDKK